MSVHMARRSRVEYLGAIYHVINRGNYRSFILKPPVRVKAFLNAWICAARRKAGSRMHGF